MKHLILLSILLYSSHTLACSIPYKESGWSKEQLVNNTKTITLVEVVGKLEAQNNKTKWKFKTLKNIKGKNLSHFELLLENAPKSYIEVNFENHTNMEFWESDYGRLPWVPGPCEPRYSFEIGGKYLIFLESLVNGASAERIFYENDKWLVYVRNKVSKQP